MCGFFADYRDAFNRRDGDAVADLWHSPSAISHPRGQSVDVTSWPIDAPMRANHRSLCAIYAARPVHVWQFEMLGHIAMGADQSFSNLRWTATSPTGETMQQFCTGYLLIRTELGPKVAHCAQYEEISEKVPT